MLRVLQAITNKNVPLLKAGAAMTRGASMGLTATGTLTTSGTMGWYLVDLPDRIGGEYAMYPHNDANNESIAQGETVVGIRPIHGERYATNQIDNVAGLTAGDGLKVASGKLAKIGSNDTAVAYFVGAYSDPDFTDLYEIVIA